MIPLIILGSIAAFVVAYFTYGKYLGRVFGLGTGQPTPAHTLHDGRDYHPARPSVLVGHHFSSIAGAGPIVGPILATVAFGWLPAVGWIVFGAIFIGAVHDYGALAVSIRHRALSIAQVVREHMSVRANKLFLVFIWLTLVYVLVVFLDLTAVTFAPRVSAATPGATAAMQRGGGVATSSILFIALALALGTALSRLKVRLLPASLVFVPLVFAAIWAGQRAPLASDLLPAINGSPTTTWALVLLLYCALASVLPVWLLLQPRDYLSSFLLYACLGGGVAGVVASVVTAGAPTVQYPAFLGVHHARLGYIYPALFITIACGACSGFHSIVASGTTAKQLDREQDARTVGYGSMLLEGVLGLLAVITVAILTPGSEVLRQHPTMVFASGLSQFLALLGIAPEVGKGFGLLALSTFLLTTLDTGTRLGRYIFEELWGLKLRGARWISTAATLALPLAFSLMTFRDPDTGQAIAVYRLVWPVFGATNQLLGALALLVISVWLRRTGRNPWVTVLPMIFMTSVTLLALVQLVYKNGLSLVGGIAAALLALALVLLVEAAAALLRPSAS